MAGLKTILGLYPKTQGYEQQRKQLLDDFNALNEYETSDELARYKELEQFVSSAEFQNKKNELFGLKYKGSEEYMKESEYLRLKKDKSIKLYFKTASSPALKQFNDTKESDSLKKYQDLEKFINSTEFAAAKQDKKTFKTSDAFQKLQEFKHLKKDSAIKQYFKFSKSKQLANYNNINGSDRLNKLEELEEYVQSEAFVEKKKYLLLKPKDRWQQNDSYKKFEEFENLKKSEKIKWYFANKGHKKFDFFRTWTVTFEDDFETGKLDTNKWLTRYYWAEKMLGESYSLAHEKHFYTEGKNLDFNGSTLKITTKREDIDGKIWNPAIGFVPMPFKYTSGIINTGNSFRQKYGLFEAKIKFANSSDVYNTFWMVGENMTPHINVVEGFKKCSLGIAFDQNQKVVKALGKSRFANDYHIFSIEWDANKIVWKINGLDVKTVSSNVPDEEMYLNFSAGLYSDAKSNLPANMEIDWVRCYNKN